MFTCASNGRLKLFMRSNKSRGVKRGARRKGEGGKSWPGMPGVTFRNLFMFGIWDLDPQSSPKLLLAKLNTDIAVHVMLNHRSWTFG